MDPHKILGIDANATQEEIRRAYRRMAKKYHPDSGGDVWAFQQVQQAYSILTGKASRPRGRKPTQPEPASAPNSTSQTAEAQNNQSSPLGNQGPSPSAGATNTGSTSSHGQFSPKAATRRKKRDNASMHVIGAIGGGICALALGFFLLKFQFAPQWASFQANESDTLDSQGSSVKSPQRAPLKSGAPTRPAPSDAKGRENTKRLESNRSIPPQSNPASRQPAAPNERELSNSSNSAVPIRRGAMTENSPEDTKWLLEFTKQAAATPKSGRLPVSETITELQKWLTEVSAADTRVKKIEVYKKVEQRLERTLSTSPMKLVFEIENVSEGERGLYTIAIGDCESDLGKDIVLKSPQYLADRIGKTLAKEIEIATHRIEVTGSPEHTLLETGLIGESFARNFIFFHDQQSPMNNEALIVYLKNPKGKIFKPKEIQPENAATNLGEFVTVTMPVAKVLVSSDDTIGVLSSKAECHAVDNFAVVIQERGSDFARIRFPSLEAKYDGRRIRVTGQIRKCNDKFMYMQVNDESRIQIADDALLDK